MFRVKFDKSDCLVSICCVYKAIQKRNVVGPGQRSRFLVLTKTSAASGMRMDFLLNRIERANENVERSISIGNRMDTSDVFQVLKIARAVGECNLRT